MNKPPRKLPNALPKDLILPEGTKAIPLSRSKYALVDETDYDFLMQWNWLIGEYAYRNNEHYENVFMHRIVLDCPPHLEVDHINGNKLDNRKANLRVCTRAENSRNRRKSIARDYKGVYWNHRARKWSVSVKCNGALHYMGLFNSKAEAALAYNEGAKKYHKKFANLNVLEGMDLVRIEDANERICLIKALETCKEYFAANNYTGHEATAVNKVLNEAYKRTPREPRPNRRTAPTEPQQIINIHRK